MEDNYNNNNLPIFYNIKIIPIQVICRYLYVVNNVKFDFNRNNIHNWV